MHTCVHAYIPTYTHNTRQGDTTASGEQDRLELESLLQSWAACLNQLHRRLALCAAGHAALQRISKEQGDKY